MRKRFIAGNWKMNKKPSEAKKLVSKLKQMVGDITEVDMAVCPAWPALPEVQKELEGSNIKVGAQNMHWKESGAYTGEVAPGMLTDLGIDYVIIGHSERRQIFNETDQDVNRKVQSALSHGLLPIVCVGETLAERNAGKTEEKVSFQVKAALAGIDSDKIEKITIAYEPIWAIGTGESASPEQASETIHLIREKIAEIASGLEEKVRIQYGGSVKPHNIADFISHPDIDGALVGGASLEAESFAEVIKKCQ
ncbi:MAG: triose-phosphate isomerase [Bacillota bacterium]